MSNYQAPVLPDDMLPPLDAQIAEIDSKWNQSKQEGYIAYRKARAQQEAAEGCLNRGMEGDYKALMEGGQSLPGVKALDAYARMKWDEARAYKTELDRLKVQKEADQHGADSNRPTSE